MNQPELGRKINEIRKKSLKPVTSPILGAQGTDCDGLCDKGEPDFLQKFQATSRPIERQTSSISRRDAFGTASCIINYFIIFESSRTVKYKSLLLAI
jgi:hypothetical protein